MFPHRHVAYTCQPTFQGLGKLEKKLHIYGMGAEKNKNNVEYVSFV